MNRLEAYWDRLTRPQRRNRVAAGIAAMAMVYSAGLAGLVSVNGEGESEQQAFDSSRGVTIVSGIPPHSAYNPTIFSADYFPATLTVEQCSPAHNSCEEFTLRVSNEVFVEYIEAIGSTVLASELTD